MARGRDPVNLNVTIYTLLGNPPASVRCVRGGIVAPRLGASPNQVASSERCQMWNRGNQTSPCIEGIEYFLRLPVGKGPVSGGKHGGGYVVAFTNCPDFEWELGEGDDGSTPVSSTFI